MTQPTWKYRGAAIQLLGLTLLLIGALQLGTELASWFTSGFMMHLGRLFWGLLMASAGALHCVNRDANGLSSSW